MLLTMYVVIGITVWFWVGVSVRKTYVECETFVCILFIVLTMCVVLGIGGFDWSVRETIG